jgi:hypothetical protein
MRQEIAHGDLAGQVGILELQRGQVLDDGVVPLQLALVDEHAHQRRRHRLRRRSDREERVLVRRIALAELPHAEALRKRNGSVFDDGDSQAGHLPVLRGLADVGFESVECGWLTENLDGCRQAEEDEQRSRQPFHRNSWK